VIDSSNLKDDISTLAVNSTFHHAGMPGKPLPEIRVQDFCLSGAVMSGGHIGNRTEAIEMLKLASELDIKNWVETIDINAEECEEAVERARKNNVRYRVMLVNYKRPLAGEKKVRDWRGGTHAVSAGLTIKSCLFSFAKNEIESNK